MLSVLKLVSGEDIMCEVKFEGEQGIYLKDPVTFVYSPHSGIMMKHWMGLTSDNYIFIAHNNILSDLGETNELGYYYYNIYLTDVSETNDTALQQLYENNSTEFGLEITKELNEMRIDKKKLH
jgi:hypothetical protein